MELYTAQQMAERYQLHEDTVRRLGREGKWEIGYHVAKAYTGKGYATEAVKAFLPVISEQVGITEVYGIRLLENAASGRG